jgi:hypothetical protein
VTSILTCPAWLDLDCSLTAAHDRLAVGNVMSSDAARLDEHAAGAAARRLAEILTAGTRFADMPLYRLTGIDVHHGEIGGSRSRALRHRRQCRPAARGHPQGLPSADDGLP